MNRVALPIDAVVPDVVAALERNAAVVVRAPTGAGKTTRVPPALLDAGLAGCGQVLLLEPRRLAARAAARRMAAERGGRVGDEIGYHVRFDRQASAATRLLVVTPGILLRRLLDDPFLESVGLLVFDEFHERGLDSDLALGIARLLQQTVRPDLRLMAMSATLAADRVASYLGGCPVVTSEGRLFPVEIAYRPRSLEVSWPQAAADATVSLLEQTDGDILVFLPGMQEIRRTGEAIASRVQASGVLVLPLQGSGAPAAGPPSDRAGDQRGGDLGDGRRHRRGRRYGSGTDHDLRSRPRTRSARADPHRTRLGGATRRAGGPTASRRVRPAVE